MHHFELKETKWLYGLSSSFISNSRQILKSYGFLIQNDAWSVDGLNKTFDWFRGKYADAKTSNRCKLLMVLLHDGIFNKCNRLNFSLLSIIKRMPILKVVL